MGQKESRRELVGGLDLVQAAKNELDFLALVDEHPSLFSGPVVKNAIRRYEHLWLPLISHHQRMHKKTDLAAPLDIAWVWHVHMLAPQFYEHDCNNIVSMLVDHCLLTPHQRQVGLQRAKSVWEKAYPCEPFEINVDEDPCLVQTYSSRIKYNLEEACQRQSKFYYQVSLPLYRDSRFLKDAVDRYMTHLKEGNQHEEFTFQVSLPHYRDSKFLKDAVDGYLTHLKEGDQHGKFPYQMTLPHYRDSSLLRLLEDAVDRYIPHLKEGDLHVTFLVPCYDHKLIWQAHQLHPTKYRQTQTKFSLKRQREDTIRREKIQKEIRKLTGTDILIRS